MVQKPEHGDPNVQCLGWNPTFTCLVRAVLPMSVSLESSHALAQASARLRARSLPAGLSAQDKPKGTPAPAPVFRSDVSLVLLPVFVIDKDGKAVRGLSAADFEVQQDGRPAEVVSFRYVDTTDADEQEELKVASAARRRFLLLFDKSFTDLPGLERSRRAAGDFVRRRLAPLGPRGGRDVRRPERRSGCVANFTDDRALLEPRDRDARRAEPRAHQRSARARGRPRRHRPAGRRSDRGGRDRRRRSSTAARARMVMPDARRRRADVPAQRRARCSTGSTSLARGAARRRGPQADPLLLGGLRLARARRRVRAPSSGDRRRGDCRAGSGRSTAWRASATAGCATRSASTTRRLAAADTVVHSIDVTGLGGDRSLTQTAVSQDLGARHHEPRVARLLRARDRRAALRQRERPRPGARRDARDDEPLLRARDPAASTRRRRAPSTSSRSRSRRKGVKLSHRPGYFEQSARARRRRRCSASSTSPSWW